MELRAEKPEDVSAVRNVNVAAFGRTHEADLVDRLRDVAAPVSCVAVESGQVVGHICFSPVQVEGKCTDLFMLGLAPVANSYTALGACRSQSVSTG